MKLLTAEILKALPPLYSQEKNPDPLVIVKFFTPWSNWTWYATEYSPEERTFFGLVVGLETELGYFNLDEMESIKGPAGLGIERDRGFHPTRLSEIRKKHDNPCHTRRNPSEKENKVIIFKLLNEIRRTHWKPEFYQTVTDDMAMGILLAQFFDYDGDAILRATYSGLEDSNWHTENKTIEKLLKGKVR